MEVDDDETLFPIINEKLVHLKVDSHLIDSRTLVRILEAIDFNRKTAENVRKRGQIFSMFGLKSQTDFVVI